MERYGARTLSSAQLRKIKKPIIERRRRERINDSLNQLKTLLLDAMHKDEADNSKMEKADILELAVSFLQNIKNYNSNQQRSSSAVASAEKLVNRYQAGYGACAREVGRYLNRNQVIDPLMASRVAGHVATKINQKPATGCNNNSIRVPVPMMMTSPMTSPLTSHMTSPIPECSRLASLPGHSMAMPLYVDTGLKSSSGRFPAHSGSHVPVLSLARSSSLSRTPSPEPAMEAHHHDSYTMANHGQMSTPSPVANVQDIAALPESPVWRPW